MASKDESRAGSPATLEEVKAQEGNGFNADERARVRANRPVTIGGRQYFPRKKTGSVIKGLLLLQPEGDEEAGEDMTREQQLDQLDNLYKQIALLVRDAETNEPPPYEAMEEDLDLEDARELLAWLFPNAERESAEGNAERTPE